MRFDILAFEWDEHNEDKIYDKHGVTAEEAEEVFYNDPLVRKAGHGRYLAFGQADDGRYLFVVFIRKSGGVVRVISARDMDRSERRAYRRKRYG